MAKDSTVVAEVLKDLGKHYDITLGAMSDVVQPVVGLPTGSLVVDYLTGVGGLPVGRVVELYGQPSAGKTTLALQAAAELQRRIIAENRDEHILYMDFEQALDLDYAGALGLDTSHRSFIVAQPVWLEDGAEIAFKLLRTGKIRLSIWDSVAEMTPRELEFGVRTAAMDRARLMRALLQQINALGHESNSCAVFLNHLTEVIGMNRPGLPPQESSPGGVALKFYSSLRLAFKIIKQIKGKASNALAGEVSEQVVATHVKVKCTKNKVGIPLREAELRVTFGAGFDNAWSALQVLLAHGVVRKDGAWYRFDEKLAHGEMTHVHKTGAPTLQGEAAVLAFADSHPEWAALLVDTAVALVNSHEAQELTITPSDDDDLLAGLETQ